MKVSIRPHATLPGWYTIDYRPNGVKGKREREHYESYDLAMAQKDALEGKPLRTEATTYPRLRDIVNEYLAWSERNQAAATYETKKCRLERHIIPVLGDRRVKDLTQRLLDSYGANMARGSYREDVIQIMALVKWMVKRHYCKPLDWKPELPAYNSGIKHLPSAPDILRFIAALPQEQHRVACTLMLYTGLRWNETRNLKWENYRNGEILLKVTKTKQPEILVVPEPCREWFETRKDGKGYIFSVDGGESHLCNLQRPLAAAEKATGVHMTAHMFRHASATYLYELTGDIYAVQHHLRHSRVTTSQVYTRYSAARRRGSVEALVGMMDKLKKAPE